MLLVKTLLLVFFDLLLVIKWFSFLETLSIVSTSTCRRCQWMALKEKKQIGQKNVDVGLQWFVEEKNILYVKMERIPRKTIGTEFTEFKVFKWWKKEPIVNRKDTNLNIRIYCTSKSQDWNDNRRHSLDNWSKFLKK